MENFELSNMFSEKRYSMRHILLFMALFAMMTAAVVKAAHDWPVSLDGTYNQTQLEHYLGDLDSRISTIEDSEVMKMEDYVSVNPTGTLESLIGPHIIFEGANVHIRNGGDGTGDDESNDLNSLGNLVIGYNESRTSGTTTSTRNGSHSKPFL